MATKHTDIAKEVLTMFKKAFAVLCVLCLLLGVGACTLSASAYMDEVDAVCWFPCEPDRQNDDLWEVQCEKEDCLCQRFTDTPADTGFENYLNTTYGADGSLTVTRTGADGEAVYWPCIRTLMLETAPELNTDVATTLYFDVKAIGCTWNIFLNFNGNTISLSRVIAEACGVSTVTTSAHDVPAGSYSGSLNLKDAINDISKEGSIYSEAAYAIRETNTLYVPQVTIFYVGDMNGSLTVNELFISSATDTRGALCEYADLELMGMGSTIYEDDAVYYDWYSDDDVAAADDGDDDWYDDSYVYDDSDDADYGDDDWYDTAPTVATLNPNGEGNSAVVGAENTGLFATIIAVFGSLSVVGIVLLILAVVVIAVVLLVVIAAVIVLIIVLVRKSKKKKAAANETATPPSE